MRIIYFGTPLFSALFLHALMDDPACEVVGLVCQPDKPVGRKAILTAPETKQAFLARNPTGTVLQPAKLRDPEFAEALKALQADVFVIVAYGRIIPAHILEIAPLGNVNVHPSLLPAWRGPSPMQASILAGDTQTGVSIMLIDAEMDHGPILAQESFALAPNETLASLTQTVVRIGAPLLLAELHKLADGTATPTVQNHDLATFCKIIQKTDGHILPTDTAEIIDRKLRAYTPWPGVRTTFSLANGTTQEVQILAGHPTQETLAPGTLRAQNNTLILGTPTTAFAITKLKPATKNAMSAGEYLRGNAI